MRRVVRFLQNFIDMESLKRTLGKIDNKFREVSTDYKRKIIGRSCNDMDILTSSLIYRKGALYFHLDLIENYLNYISEYLSQPEGINHGALFYPIEGMRMNYLLDDFIFNMVSFYDYFATFGGYIFYGEIIRNKAIGYDPLNIKNEKIDHLNDALSNISWKKFANLANTDPSRKSNLEYDPKILHASTFSKEVVKWNRSFIYDLIELRHDIIHNKITPVSNSFSLNPTDGGKYDFKVHGMFVNKFPNVSNSYDGVLTFFIENFTESLLKFCDCLKQDIEDNRKVEKGKEFIKYKSEHGRET